MTGNFQTLTGRAPVFIGAEVGLLAANTIVLKYGKSPDPASKPATTDFTVVGTVQTISSIIFWGNDVRLVMSASLLSTDTLTVSYTNGTNPLRDTSKNESLNLVNKSVTNNI